jgi:tetratricopeptide (TPR) repeat protein
MPEKQMMRTRIQSILTTVMFAALPTFFIASSPSAQENGSPVSIGTYRTLHSQILHEDRTLLVNLPRGYDESAIRYPVLYVLYGGQVQGYFAESVHIVHRLSEVGMIPQLIIVGVQNVDRYRDNLPVGRGDQKAGAENFLKFFKDELAPFIDSSYRTKDFRILLGPQAGAAFGLYALMQQPELFRVNIITDPFWNRPVTEYLLTEAAGFFAQEGSVGSFLFITCNSSHDTEATLEDLKKLRELVQNGKRKEVVLVLDALGEKKPDSSIVASGLREGLKTYFKGLELPEDLEVDGIEDVEGYYRARSQEYGFDVEIPERTLINLGVELRRGGKVDDARLLYERAAKQYPGEVNSYFQLADLHRAEGNYEEAIKYYEEFLARRSEPMIEQRLLALRKYAEESAAHAVEETIKRSGVDAGTAQYRKMRSAEGEDLYFRENEFNAVGYHFLVKRKIDAAIAVFKMTVDMNPESANAHDSLAEAYMLNGNRESAVEHYRKSLELNPENANAREKLSEIEEAKE